MKKKNWGNHIMESSTTKNKNLNKSFGSLSSSLGYVAGGAISGGSVSGGPNKEPEKFKGNYFQWIKEELSGWDTFPWVLFGFGAGLQVMSFALNPINWISVVTLIGTMFGMLCTVAMCAGGYVNGKRVISRSINGLLGGVSVIAFIITNLSMGHYFSVIDQLVFFFLIDVELMVTWRTWGRGKNQEIKKLSNKGYSLAGISMLIAWVILYFVGIQLNDQQPIFDSLVLAMGAVASWLCFKRYSLTYKIWLLSDLVQIGLFVATIVQAGFTQASLAMILNYGFYFATAIVGLINWKPTVK